MSSKKFRLKLVIVAITLIYSGFCKAEDVVSSSSPISPASLPALEAQDTSTVGNNSIFFPFYPRLNLYGGIGSNSYARADGMIPVMGSMNGIVYTDIDMQRSSSSSHYFSLGLGGRNATSDDFMWGGYVFADRISSNTNNISNNWTVFNPGIEYMTNYWDGRLNIYYPTTQQQTVTSGLFADQVGQPNEISFSGHNQYSGLFNEEQEIGPGADIDFGYTFTHLNRFRIHAGGYYFSPQDTDKVHGGEIGAELPINNYFTVEAIDTYDNVQNNKAEISLRVTLGGTDKSSSTPTVQDRLLDPVYHNFAGLTEGTVAPISDQVVATDQTVLERSNIWFFTPGGSAFNASNGSENCTYEHPCSGSSFNQSTAGTINGIAHNANFYFNPGTYSIGNFYLYSGQSMYGRTSDYTLPASQGSQPIFVGTLNPLGNNTLDSFALINTSGTYSTGISISNTSNVAMNNLSIGGQTTSTGYMDSINLNGANNISLNNSSVNSSTTSFSQGIELTNSNMTMNNDVVTMNNIGGNLLNAIGNSTLTVTNSTLTLSGTGTQRGAFTQNAGSTINLSYDIFTISGGTSQPVALSSLDGKINANNSVFNLSTTATTDIGVLTQSSSSAITLQNNTFNISSSSPNSSYGMANGAGTITANNNTFNFSGTGTKICTQGTITGSGNTYNGC